MVHSRYQWNQKAYLEALSTAFELRLVNVIDDLPDDPMPPELAAATARVCLGMRGVRVPDYTTGAAVRLWRGIAPLVRMSDAVLTSTQNPVHSKAAWAAARLYGKPLLVVIEQWRDYPWKGVAHAVYDRLSLGLMRSATRCFVHGSLAGEFCRRNGVDPERIRVYPHINADLAGGADRRSTDERFRFLSVARLVEVKGLDVLIDAFARVRAAGIEASLEIAGDGPLRSRLEAQADALGVPVRFAGRVPPRELAGHMASCDAFVLASRSAGGAYEGWGLAAGEAASASRPLVVTSAVGCAPEFVREGVNGFVVPEGDVDALASAMERLARDPRAAAEMGRRSRARFEEYCDPAECVRLIGQAL